MLRKITSILQSLLAVIIILSTSGCRFPLLKDERPNFLIIVTDDQRFDTMEYMPNTRQLIFDQGVTFSRGYITTPFCCPSRASILTGLYAHNHYVLENTDKLRLPTLVEDLQKNGYYTGLVGKYLNSWDGEARPEFDYWISFFGGTVPSYYDPERLHGAPWRTSGNAVRLSDVTVIRLLFPAMSLPVLWNGSWNVNTCEMKHFSVDLSLSSRK